VSEICVLLFRRIAGSLDRQVGNGGFGKITLKNLDLLLIRYIIAVQSKGCRLSDFFNYFPVTARESFDVPDLESKYRRLVRGMDTDSARTVSRCLDILRLLADLDARGAPHPPMSEVFTPDEVDEIVTQEAMMEAGISQLSDGSWAFGEFILPINSFEYCTFINRCGLDTIELPLGYLSDSAIIDAGGYIGDTAILLRKYFPDNKIYSFEPIADTFELMLQTVALNGAVDEIIPVQLALSDVPDSTDRALDLGSCSRLDANGGEIVSVDTLDNWAARNGVGRIGLIKADIEGAEQKLLRGALQTIRRDRPVMLLSIYHNPDDYFGIKPLIEDMDLGYRFRIFKPMYRDVITETLLICLPK
jgi:FkbM family methyltransferase